MAIYERPIVNVGLLNRNAVIMNVRTSSEHTSSRFSWLNRNVFAMGLTSFLGDFCHEMATAILPQFMQAIGASVTALGVIEGSADALSSFVKLGAGYHSDKIGRRKLWTVTGYFLTGISKALFALRLTGSSPPAMACSASSAARSPVCFTIGPSWRRPSLASRCNLRTSRSSWP